MGTPIERTRCGVCHEVGHDRRWHRRTEVTCRTCGKVERVPPHRAETYVGCSRVCGYAYRSQRPPTERERAHLVRLHAGIREGRIDTANKMTVRTLRAEVARLTEENEGLRARVEELSWKSQGFDSSSFGTDK